MKLICDREKFAKAFHTVSGVAAGGKSSQPVLSNVRVRETGQVVTLYATDMELWVSCEIHGDDVTPGFDVLLLASRFHSIISESRAETIEIKWEGNSIEVTCDGASYILPTESPQTFPIVIPSEGSRVLVSARAVRQAIRQTSFCTDLASNRYSLSGVHFDLVGREMHFVGTDGRRLAHATVIVAEDFAPMTGIIPMKACKTITEICDVHGGDCAIHSDLNSITVSVDGSVVNSRLVEGRYPAWRRVLPDVEPYTTVPIMPDDLASAIRQAAIVSDKEGRGVKMVLHKGTIEFSAATADIGKSKVMTVVPYDGDRLEINVDYKFVGDFCKACTSGETIDMLVAGPNLPMVLKSGDSYEYVVMPMANV